MHDEQANHPEQARPRPKKYPRQLTIRVPEEMYQAIMTEAAREGLDPADIIRRALRHGLGLGGEAGRR